MGVIQFISCIVLFSLVFCDGAKLPNYLKACRLSDPELSKCAKQHALDAVDHILKGDKTFNVPVLAPLKLPLINIQASESLNLKLKDAILNGLEIIEIDDVLFDIKNHHILVQVSSKRFNLEGEYEINGRIVLLPIQGHGHANITLVNSHFNYSLNYDLTKKSDGKQYVTLKDHNIKYESGRSYYQFDNLFNGDEKLGNQMNSFLNENWKDVSDDLNPSVSEVVDQIVTQILKGYFDKIPFEEIFLP